MSIKFLQRVPGGQQVISATFRAPISPLRVNGGLAVTAGALTGTEGINGIISGTLSGTITHASGVIQISGTALFDPDEVRVNGIGVSYLPLDPDLLGIDATQIPITGRVPIFQAGDTAIVFHTASIVLPNPLSNGYVADCGRIRLAYVRIVDQNEKRLPQPDNFTVDRQTGIVTFANPINLSEYAQPLVLHHTIADRLLVTSAELNGLITFLRPLSHDYPSGSFIASAAVLGDLYAVAGVPWSEQAFISWADEIVGSPILAQYNHTQYPIVVTSRGAIHQRWLFQFTSGTNFNFIGEELGVIGQGTINTDFSPINPARGVPYLTMDAEGWGLGWQAGNIVRVNTFQVANAPIWLVQTVLPSEHTEGSDRFLIRLVGDRDQ